MPSDWFSVRLVHPRHVYMRSAVIVSIDYMRVLIREGYPVWLALVLVSNLFKFRFLQALLSPMHDENHTSGETTK